MKRRDAIAFAAVAVVLGAVAGGAEAPSASPVVPGRDTIPSATTEFRVGHTALVTDFRWLMSRAVDPASTHRDRARLVLYLRAEILPHLRAEQQVLYPAIDSVLGTKGYATVTMVLEHEAIARLVEDVSALATSTYPEAYRRRLDALDALLESHFAKEEEFILPILRQMMTEGELRALLARMEAFPRPEEWP